MANTASVPELRYSGWNRMGESEAERLSALDLMSETGPVRAGMEALAR